MTPRRKRGTMPEYHCRALDSDDNVLAVEVVQYGHDEFARLRAAIILANCDVNVVEAWEGGRLVCRVWKPAAAAAPIGDNGASG